MWRSESGEWRGHKKDKHTQKKKKKKIRKDRHRLLTENRRGRWCLIKRYWTLVTGSSISWQLYSYAASWNPIFKGWFSSCEQQQCEGEYRNPAMSLALKGHQRSKEKKKLKVLASVCLAGFCGNIKNDYFWGKEIPKICEYWMGEILPQCGHKEWNQWSAFEAVPWYYG